MTPFEWIVLVVAVLAGSIAAGRRSIAVMAWIRGREVDMRVTCPKRGSRARCTLVVDDERRVYVGVTRCSLCIGAPRCEEDCVKLLNHGLPIEDDGREPALREAE